MKLFDRNNPGHRAMRLFERELKSAVSWWADPEQVSAIMVDMKRVMSIGYQLGVGPIVSDEKADVWLKCPKCPPNAGGYGFTREAIASALKMKYKCGRHNVLLEVVDNQFLDVVDPK